MDKIITINLGGYAIKMEEDAYEALKPYIRQIEEKFANTENGKEIINDIEARIAEMLMELTENKVAASLSDVEFIKKNMGNPGEFEDQDAEAGPKHQATQNETVRKRLYRDSENKVFGGVCSGLSNYLNLDPVVIRLIWVLLLFFFGTGLLVYFILWIIVPEAITTAQKLEMKGEAPTFDNIINRVKTEAGKVEQNLKSQNFGQKIGDIFRGLSPVFLAFFKVIAMIIGISLLIALSVVFIALITGGTNFMFNDNGVSINQIPNIFDAGWQFVTVKILIGLFIGIPLFTILTGLLKFVFSSDVNYRPIRHVLGWVWAATIPGLLYFAYTGVKNFKSFETVSIEKTERMSKPITIRGEFDEEGYFFGGISVNITSSEDNLIHITTSQSANSQNKAQAREMAKNNGAGYSVSGKELVLRTSDYYNKLGLFRNQKVVFDIRIPNGSTFYLDHSLKAAGVSVRGLNINYYNNEDDEHEKLKGLLFLNSNLFCPECPDSIPFGGRGLMNYSNFKQIEVEGTIDIEIYRGNRFSIQKVGPTNIISHLDINQYDNKLILEMEHGYFNLKTRPKVIITMPEIESLNLSGASECKMDRFAGDKFTFESSGASHAKLAVAYGEVRIDMSGASHLEIEGNAKTVTFNVSGVTHINSENLNSDMAEVDISGACEMILGMTRSIKGVVSGASNLEYIGHPDLQVNADGVSKIRQYKP